MERLGENLSSSPLLLFGLLVFQIKDFYDKAIDKEEGKGDLGRGIAT